MRIKALAVAVLLSASFVGCDDDYTYNGSKTENYTGMQTTIGACTQSQLDGQFDGTGQMWVNYEGSCVRTICDRYSNTTPVVVRTQDGNLESRCLQRRTKRVSFTPPPENPTPTCTNECDRNGGGQGSGASRLEA